MQIEMKTLSATPERTLQPGQRYRVTDAEGRDLVDGGWAVEIDRDGRPVQPSDTPRQASAPRRRGRGAAKASPGAEPLTESELAAARERGLPVDDPDRTPDPAAIRAALAGDVQDA